MCSLKEPKRAFGGKITIVSTIVHTNALPPDRPVWSASGRVGCKLSEWLHQRRSTTTAYRPAQCKRPASGCFDRLCCANCCWTGCTAALRETPPPDPPVWPASGHFDRDTSLPCIAKKRPVTLRKVINVVWIFYIHYYK